MDTERKTLIINGFGILASIFILLSGAIVARAMIDLLVQIFGALFIIWAIIVIKTNKSSQQTKLPKGYFFIQTGPYEIIRHPIYAGYLLIMLSFVEIEFTFLRLVALAILGIVILMRIIREEHTLSAEISGYNDYKKKTKALIPYLL